jgi:hypothetical protein
MKKISFVIAILASTSIYADTDVMLECRVSGTETSVKQTPLQPPSAILEVKIKEVDDLILIDIDGPGLYSMAVLYPSHGVFTSKNLSNSNQYFISSINNQTKTNQEVAINRVTGSIYSKTIFWGMSPLALVEFSGSCVKLDNKKRAF